MNQLWEINQNNYDSKINRKKETVFTLANGYRGIRGAIEFSDIGERGNYIAGIFDKSEAQVTEIVNCPDPLVLNLYVEDESLNIEQCEVVEFNRTLDMKAGVLYTDLQIKTPKGKITKIETKRFVSRNNVHRWGAQYSITPLNYSGKLFIENVINGTVTNSMLDPFHKTKHFNIEEISDLKPGIALQSITRDDRISMIEGTVLKGISEDGNFLKNRKFRAFGETAREIYEVFVNENKTYTLEKYGVTYTSRDTDDKLSNVLKEDIWQFIDGGLESELNLHINEWNKLWENMDIVIEGDDLAQQGLRFNIFHLSSMAYSGDERISIAAKGLHGEGYKGHVFWDTEIFMLPFFVYTNPEVAKSLLLYRYNLLEGAKKNAVNNGYKGAQYPWESASDGLEVTPKWGIDYDGNPVRIWTGDEEFHINADIAFGIWEYYRTTKDKDFLQNYGLLIFFETAKFWASRVEYNKELDRFEINRVIGPDEFHEHVDNNFYTNYFAKWNMKKAVELVDWIKQEDNSIFERLCVEVGLNDSDFDQWKNIINKIYIPVDESKNLIEQFEGYFKLKDIPITEYDENQMPVWPDFQGYKLDETQLLKQPDVIMLLLLLGSEFDDITKKANYRYYEARTMHKSSLSPSMYSIMGLSVGDTENAYKYFIKTIMTDLEDNQGNTEHGIHAASTGGSWQSAVFGFGGLYIDEEQEICFSPWIPENWNTLSFNVNWRNSIVNVTITQNDVKISSTGTTTVKVYNNSYTINPVDTTVISRNN